MYVTTIGEKEHCQKTEKWIRVRPKKEDLCLLVFEKFKSMFSFLCDKMKEGPPQREEGEYIRRTAGPMNICEICPEPCRPEDHQEFDNVMRKFKLCKVV